MEQFYIFTTCKRSLGQGNVFTPACHSIHREGGRRGVCITACNGQGLCIPTYNRVSGWGCLPLSLVGVDPLDIHPQADTPFLRHTPGQIPLGHTSPWTRPPVGYASYWNAFLLQKHFVENICSKVQSVAHTPVEYDQIHMIQIHSNLYQRLYVPT